MADSGRHSGGSDKSNELFTIQMRKATREIHAISDALVNTKLAFALSDNAVWAEGLLIFYEIFRFLEDAALRLKGTSVGEVFVDGMQRTEAFQRDLQFYLGPDWSKNYSPRENVAKYLLHLQKLENSDPVRLIAYIYHLYMGLFSGGQILRRKRALAKKIRVLDRINLFKASDCNKCGGDAVTDFGEKKIYELKKELVNNVISIAATLTDQEKQNLIEESKIVFELNNSIIKTVRGMDEVILRKLLMYAIIICCIIMLYYIVF